MLHHNLALFNDNAGLLLYSEPFKDNMIRGKLVPVRQYNIFSMFSSIKYITFVLNLKDIAAILLLVDLGNSDNDFYEIIYRIHVEGIWAENGHNDGGSFEVKGIIRINNGMVEFYIQDRDELHKHLAGLGKNPKSSGGELLLFSLDGKKTRILLELFAHIFGEIMFKKIESSSSPVGCNMDSPTSPQADSDFQMLNYGQI